MNVKGTAVRARFEFVKERFGAPGLQRALEALEPEDRRTLEIALPASWIPVRLIDRLDGEIARLGGGLDVARAYGAASAHRNLSVFYRSVEGQADGDPHALLAGLSPLHNNFYDEGRMRATETGPGRCRVEIDFAGSAAPFRCQVSVGFLEGALQRIGVLGLQVDETQCQTRGEAVCRIELVWQPAREVRPASKVRAGAEPLTAG